jgi:dihydroflavonol-4-reductase
MSLAGHPAGPCLVTGATGLVGNNVVRLLVDRGVPVRVLARPGSPRNDRAFAGLPVERVEAPLDDDAALDRAVAGTSAVVHSAAVVHIGWKRLAEMREVNVEGARRVAAACRRAGVRLLHVSAIDALGRNADGRLTDEETPPGGWTECSYVVTKREAEAAVLAEVERGLDAVIVNPVYMLGPWDWKPSSGRMLLEVATGLGILAPGGSNDFVDVRDVAAGILAAIDRGRTGRRYILGGHRRTYLDAWRMFARVAGVMPPLGTVPRPLVRLVGRCGDLWGGIIGREPDVNSAAVEMSLLHHVSSCRRAEQELGYAYRPLEETVADAWDWFVDHGFTRSRRRAAAGPR